MKKLFELGQIGITSKADKTLSHDDILNAILCHISGDWGDMNEDNRETNNTALKSGGRLFSIYHDSSGTEFWIITADDRSKTMILLPEKY